MCVWYSIFFAINLLSCQHTPLQSKVQKLSVAPGWSFCELPTPLQLPCVFSANHPCPAESVIASAKVALQLQRGSLFGCAWFCHWFSVFHASSAGIAFLSHMVSGSLMTIRSTVHRHVFAWLAIQNPSNMRIWEHFFSRDLTAQMTWNHQAAARESVSPSPSRHQQDQGRTPAKCAGVLFQSLILQQLHMLRSALKTSPAQYFHKVSNCGHTISTSCSKSQVLPTLIMTIVATCHTNGTSTIK